jgi:hypothetical protein
MLNIDLFKGANYMADYTSRSDELAKKIETLQKEITPAKSPSVTPTTWETLKNNLASYLDWRERLLADGLLFPSNVTSDATGDSAQDKWTSFFRDRAGESVKKVEKLLDRPDPALLEFLDFTCLQESFFFNAIADMPMARFLGEMRQVIKDLKQKKQDYVAEWGKISQLDQQRDQDWAVLRAKIYDESRRVMEDILGLNRKLGDFAIKALPFVVAKTITIPLGGPAGLIVNFIADQGIKSVVKSLLEKINATRPTIDNFVNEAQRKQSEKCTIITVFNNKREEVQRIISVYNPDVVQVRYYDLANKTRDAAGKAKTTGTVEDAKKFAERLITASRVVVDEFNTCYGEFTSALNGIFVGSLSSNTEEQLAEAAFFQNFMKDYAAIDLYGGFNETAEDVAKIFNVSLDSWDDKNREQIKELLRIEFEPLSNEIKKLDKGAFNRVGNFVGDCAKAIKDKVKK